MRGDGREDGDGHGGGDGGDREATGRRVPYGRVPAYGEAVEEESSLVRMYAVTGGRTVPSGGLAMEALVSTATADRLGLSYVREYRLISDLCRRIHSVVEISALLGVPLGVARVLVSDMEAEGLVRVHRPRLDAGRPGPAVLERVLGGLDRL
ncbi:DUF742 domain-containing protein [Streptosporangium sp. DT93]|uniref:DUF742 domain-containing protein n=1 Tax=Streptosporangium sp. DT93 TaxID=3393428 RepID=UPI003CEEFDC6